MLPYKKQFLKTSKNIKMNHTAKNIQYEAKMQAKIIEMDTRTIYQQNGFKDRESYLKSLCDEYGADMYTVSSIADMLGKNEDFDGLISSLNDFSHLFNNDTD